MSGDPATAQPVTVDEDPLLVWIAPDGPDHGFVFFNTHRGTTRLRLHRAALADLNRNIAALLAGDRARWPQVAAASGAKLQENIDADTGEKLTNQAGKER